MTDVLHDMNVSYAFLSQDVDVRMGSATVGAAGIGRQSGTKSGHEVTL